MGPGTKGNENVSALSTTSSDPLAESVPPVPMTLCSACQKFWFQKGQVLMSGGTANLPLNWRLRLLLFLATWTSDVLGSMGYGATGKMIDPDF